MAEYIVRWERHGDSLYLPIPAEVVERLQLVVGDIALLRDDQSALPAEFAENEAVRRMQKILEENPNAFAAISK